jgi:trk system potassium uptake protein
MKTRFIFYITGFVLCFFSVAMLIPSCMDIFFEENKAAVAFLKTAGVGFIIGMALILKHRFLSKESFQNISLSAMFMTTSFCWIVISFFCALPFYWAGFGFSFTDCLFESVSGITTTGASILTELSSLTFGLQLWRFMLHWIGGLGVILTAVLILPSLKTKGMQLFSTETSEIGDKSFPLFSQNIKVLIISYLSLSLACWFCLAAADLPIYEALLYTMSIISTGGFSLSGDAVQKAFTLYPLFSWVASFFMIISALPLIGLILLYNKRTDNLKNDSQIKTFLGILCSFIIFVVVWRLFNEKATSVAVIIKETVFTMSSFATTTGLFATNYESWGAPATVLFMLAMTFGGCAGSTSGGLKSFRVNILFKSFWLNLKSLGKPHSIFTVRFNKEPLSETMFVKVGGFLSVFLFCLLTFTFLSTLFGADLLTAFSSSLTGLTNTGLGFGKMTGFHTKLAELPTAVKMIFSVAMLAGRLEFLTFFSLFLPSLWRRG